MPKRSDDEAGDELTGMDHGDRTSAAGSGQAADDRDVRSATNDERDDERTAFDPSSRGDETGETL